MSSRIGKKGLKGQPIYYEQVKHKHTIWLTDESWLMLQKEAKQQKTSVSELIEKYSQLLKLAQNAQL